MINLYVFLFGGFGYGILEILWRGYTHISMILVGGICSVIVWQISAKFKNISLFRKSLLCAAAITVIELLSGLIINVGMGLSVWDYSQMKYNIAGQVCLHYTLMWFVLSVFLIPICDFIHNKNLNR